MTTERESDMAGPALPRRGLAALLLVAASAACGRKGALYMPDEEPDRRVSRQTPTPTTPEGAPLPPDETEHLPDVEDEQ